MSLINQMLCDLEARRAGHRLAGVHALDGLHGALAVHDTDERSVAVSQYLLAVAIGAVAACAVWYGLGMIRHGQNVNDRHAADLRVAGAVADAPTVSRAISAPVNVAPPVEAAEVVPAAADVDVAGAALAPAGDRLSAALASMPPVVGGADPAAASLDEQPPAPATAVPGANPARHTAKAARGAARAVPAEAQPLADELSAGKPEPEPELEYPGTMRMDPHTTGNTRQRALERYVAGLRGPHADAALAGLAKMVEHHADYVAARLAYATELVRRKSTASAERVLNEGLKLDPHQYAFASMLAHLEVDRGALAPALARLMASAPAVGDSPDYHAFIAALQERLGQHQAAIVTYRMALGAAPGHGAWWVGLAIALLGDHQDEPALLAFRRALADPGLSQNLRGYANREIGRLTNTG